MHEGFLNKSLLDQLDAQADAEPTESGTSDDSSHGSPRAHEPFKIDLKMNQFYPRASFSAFPNASATRAPPRTAVAPPQFYPQDPFSPQLTSPVYDPRASLDFGSYPQQQQQRAMHSQTPYGPHVPMNGPGLPPPSMMGPMGAMQEDISTIFVVGFPEDMQEREFQNMFTFSPGFEAATLKIPNKEYTAYGGVGVLSPQQQPAQQQQPNGNATQQQPALRGGGTYNAYAGSNDPYNLVTVNQGGVLVDAGREGGIASWPAPAAQPQAAAPNPNEDGQAQQQPPAFAPGGVSVGGAGILPPRKQIIGFAKFRTREEALGARDVLQGRRVDIDKGAVLKAEMAKKNLHTKRGVGPVGGGVVGGGMVGGGGMGIGVGVNGGMMNGMNGGMGMNEMYGADQALSPREREAGALVAMGLPPPPPGSSLPNNNNINNPGLVGMNGHHTNVNGASARMAWRGDPLTSDEDEPIHQMQHLEHERERERERRQSSVLGAMGFQPRGGGVVGVGAGRGARERAEEARGGVTIGSERASFEDGERRRERKAFEAFTALGGRDTAEGGPWDGPRLMNRRSPSPEGYGPGVNGIAPFAGEAPRAFSSPPPPQHLAEYHHHQQQSHHLQHLQSQHFGYAGNNNNNAYFGGDYDHPQQQYAPQQHQQHQQGGYQHPPQHQHQHVAHRTERSESDASGGELERGMGRLAVRNIAPGPGPGPIHPNNNPANSNSAAHSNTHTPNPPISIPSAASGSASASGSSGGSPQLASPASSGSGSHAGSGSGSGSGSGVGSGSGGGGVGRAVDQNPPINTLYVGNLPALPSGGAGAGNAGAPTMEYLEGTLRELFAGQPGFRQMSFRPKGNGPMCFVEFEDVGYATKTLNELYGNTLGGLIKGGGIRLSYSKNPLGVRTPTSASGGGPTLQQQQQQGQGLGSLALGAGQQSMAAAEAAFHQRLSLTSPPPPPQPVGYDAPVAVAAYPAPRFFGAAPEGAWGRRWESATVPRAVAGTSPPQGINGNGAGASFSPFAHSPAPTEQQQQTQESEAP